MGGFGSGWQELRCATVEDSYSLSLSDLRKQNLLVDGDITLGAWRWQSEYSREPVTLHFVTDLWHRSSACMHLTFERGGLPRMQKVSLESTQPNFGGHRWWFVCPILEPLGIIQRTTKLHMPPGSNRFGCRQAYGLSYRSCQESGCHLGFYRMMAAKTGLSLNEIRKELRNAYGP
jgi:hypothetical protein